MLCYEIQLCPNEDERFSFHVEWYDHNASLVRKYLFHFYERDATVEMVSHLTILAVWLHLSQQSLVVYSYTGWAKLNRAMHFS